MDPVPVIIPSLLTEEQLAPLVRLIEETAGCPHRIIMACGKRSAAANRNLGLDRSRLSDSTVPGMVAMLDDDIEPISRGWLEVMISALSRTEVVMVSAQLYRPTLLAAEQRRMRRGGEMSEVGGGYAFMTGLQDWGGIPQPSGETFVRTKRLLTACCAFKPSGCRFDEGYVGSGFEDCDYSNQLAAAVPDGEFLVCHSAHVIHRNEQREQRGENWENNKALYESKWGRIETREEMRRKYG